MRKKQLQSLSVWIWYKR